MSTPSIIPTSDVSKGKATNNVSPTWKSFKESLNDGDRAMMSELVTSFQHTLIEDKPPVTFVDTSAGMNELLSALANLPVKPPSLYVDLEGVDLSRYGTISLMQIFVLPLRRTFLIDIHILKGKAFSQPGPSGLTLRSVLESPLIPKVFFDVRNDSDALFAHYQIDLAGIQDLQLMELATRSCSKRLVRGLGKCMEYDAPMTRREREDWKRTKETGRRLFAPEMGGSYEVFNTRPLTDEILQYCAQDVQFLPKLWQKYHEKMSLLWEVKVEAESKCRVRLSQSPTYFAKGKDKALGPRHWS
ncbi:hypothetical protein N7490_001182 [Penicillium lividum]|nr:hypothetical protein N7490_001182 [Penicillium lividum]